MKCLRLVFRQVGRRPEGIVRLGLATLAGGGLVKALRPHDASPSTVCDRTESLVLEARHWMVASALTEPLDLTPCPEHVPRPVFSGSRPARHGVFPVTEGLENASEASSRTSHTSAFPGRSAMIRSPGSRRHVIGAEPTVRVTRTPRVRGVTALADHETHGNSQN